MKTRTLRGPIVVLIVSLVSWAPLLGSQALAPDAGGESIVVLGGQDCAGGVVKDDGTLETGYGWVPSAVDGRYVQRFEVADFRSRKLEEVCICWTRTLPDDSVTFRIELYRDHGGRPFLSPDASLEVVADGVPTYPEGAFYSFDVSDVDMHAQTNVFYLGVQWDPSEDEFFFVCADQSAATPAVDGWYIDDRADEWTSVLETSDPIFAEHRAMMIRAQALEGFFPTVPMVGRRGAVVLAVLISLLGTALLLHRRR